MNRAGVNSYYHFDGLGSVVALSNNSGKIVERYSYDVFGEPSIRDSCDVTRDSSAYGNPYLFTGREFDSETGNYYYRARYYSPAIGRFLQADPFGIVPDGDQKNPFMPTEQYYAGTNLYTYVGNNPLNGRDPFGLATITREYCKGLYDKRVRNILIDQHECMKDCGVSPVGPETAGCITICWKTGAYFPVCLAGCESVFLATKATCHYLCARITNNALKSARNALDRCLDRACD